MNEPPERENDIQDPLPKECALKWDRKNRLGYMEGKGLPQKKGQRQSFRQPGSGKRGKV